MTSFAGFIKTSDKLMLQQLLFVGKKVRCYIKENKNLGSRFVFKINRNILKLMYIRKDFC